MPHIAMIRVGNVSFDAVVHLINGLLGTMFLLCAGTVKVKDEFLPLLPILCAALKITPKKMKELMWSFSMGEKWH